MDIIDKYHKHTVNIINQIKISHYDYYCISQRILESLKSVYLCCMKSAKKIIEKENKSENYKMHYVLNILNPIPNECFLNMNENKSILTEFIDKAEEVFDFFYNQYPVSENLIKDMCSFLKKVCESSASNNDERYYWLPTEFDLLITDELAAKQALVYLYLFIELLFLYCIREKYDINTFIISNDNPDDYLNNANIFYDNEKWNYIQFFLPLESDVTMSYFIYRYLIPENISKELGKPWAMGNKAKKAIPPTLVDLIRLIDSSIVITPSIINSYNSRAKKLNKNNIFNSCKIDSEDKVKIMNLINTMLYTHSGNEKGYITGLNLLVFLKDTNEKYFKEYDSLTSTNEIALSTILFSELLKELPINFVYSYLSKYFIVEIKIKKVIDLLQEYNQNNCYSVFYRGLIWEMINTTYNNSIKLTLDGDLLPVNDAIQKLFVRITYNKAVTYIQKTRCKYMFINKEFKSLFLLLPSTWDGNKEEQEKRIAFATITPQKFTEWVQNIKISFKNESEARKELNRIIIFFQLYFPEKYYIDQRCTLRELLSAYELLDNFSKLCGLTKYYKIKSISAPKQLKITNSIKLQKKDEVFFKKIKAALAAKKTPQMESYVRGMIKAQIEMHNMSNNYNSFFIPTLLSTINILHSIILNSNNNKSPDYDSLNRLYEHTLSLNLLIDQIGKFLFLRAPGGIYESDINSSTERQKVDPEIQAFLDNVLGAYDREYIRNNPKLYDKLYQYALLKWFLEHGE